MSKISVTIGTDPEVFVKNASGFFVSGHDLIPGTKEMPFPVGCGAVQVDGLALEFNTNPASTAEEFMTNIKNVMSQMEGMFKTTYPEYSIEISPTATFDQEYFDGLPETTRVLGCTPDFNAYTGVENDPPHTDEPFRTGAGHVHIGWGGDHDVEDEKHFSLCRDLVKQLDTILYPNSLLWDSDEKRRTLYGKIGSFRPKFYGVEYRPLSNAYLKTPITQKRVFDISKKASELLLNEGIKLFEDAVAIDFNKKLQEGKTPNIREIGEYLAQMRNKYGSFATA